MIPWEVEHSIAQQRTVTMHPMSMIWIEVLQLHNIGEYGPGTVEDTQTIQK